MRYFNRNGRRCGCPLELSARLLAAALVGAILLSGGQASADEGEASAPEKSQLQVMVELWQKSGLAVSNASFTVVDRQPPSIGAVSSPNHTNATPITITYSGASDIGASGLKTVTLWVKPGAGGTWVNAGLTSTGDAGLVHFYGITGEQEYFFALQAEDNAQNLSPTPTGAGATSTVFDITPPEIALLGNAAVQIIEGTPYVDAGATAFDTQDGSLSGRVVTVNPVNSSVPGVYVVRYNVADAAGNTAPEVTRTVTVLPAYELALLQPAYGSITASPAPGPTGKYALGTTVTLAYVAATGSGYELSSWIGAQEDLVDRTKAYVTMDADKSVSVNLARERGTVAVSVTPDAASWVVTDGDGGTHNGSGDSTLTDIPAGTVSIEYQALTWYQAPASETATLAKNSTVTFEGVYTGSFVWGDVDGDERATPSDATTILRYRVGLTDRLPVTTVAMDSSYLGGADVSGDEPSRAGTLDSALILQKSAGLLATFPADLNGDGRGPETPGKASAGDAFAKALAEHLEKERPRVISMVTAISGAPGIEVKVPVWIDDAASVLGYFFEITYDLNRLEFIHVGNGTLTGKWNEPVLQRKPGQLRLAGAGSQSPVGAGSLAVFTFRTLTTMDPSQSATLQLAVAELNDEAVPAQIRSAGAAPVIDRVDPAYGAGEGGTVVTLTGSNLNNVYEVLFGDAPAAWLKVKPGLSTITVITPAGAGTVDVQVLTPNGMAMSPAAFTYLTPDINLSITPEPKAKAGQILEVPVWVSTPGGGQASALSFKLHFDNELFTVKREGDVAVPGDAAIAAGKQITAHLERPDELLVTVDDGALAETYIPPGLLCTCHLLVISNTNDVMGLIYLADVTATGEDAKSLSSMGGTQTQRENP